MRLKTNKLNFYVEDEVREKLEKLTKKIGTYDDGSCVKTHYGS